LSCFSDVLADAFTSSVVVVAGEGGGSEYSPRVHIRSRTVGEGTLPTLGFGHVLIAWPKVSSLMVDANPSPEPLATLFGDLVSTR